MIHGALPKVHMLLSPYLLPIDGRPRLFTLRVPPSLSVCLSFGSLLVAVSGARSSSHAARHAACWKVAWERGMHDARRVNNRVVFARGGKHSWDVGPGGGHK